MVLGRRRISSRHTRRCARSRSLGGLGHGVDGIRSTGMSPSRSYSIFAAHATLTREKLYTFFMSLKQPDGSFLVGHHAEIDVR